MLLPQLNLRRGLCLAALAVLAGCKPQEPIVRYTVTKPELIDPTLTAAAPAPAEAKATQMLGVIVPIGMQSWFFKMTGDPAAIEPSRQAFLEFVKAIKFSAGDSPEPTWKLPMGWQDLPPKQFGFATLGFSAGGQPLEITISAAGGDLLTNLNRWHQQVGLPGISESELPTKTETIQVDGRAGTFVSLLGKAGGRMGGAPFAPFAGGAMPPSASPPIAAPSAGSGDLQYEVPKEWTKAPNDPVSMAAFAAADGDKRVKITISEVGGDLLSNVNRWRGQVSLPPITLDELAKSVQKIETLGGVGEFVEATGGGGITPAETILGVRATAGGATWFIKLRGDRDLAARERARFEAFVKSVKLK